MVAGLPLTANGKLDRAALPVPDLERVAPYRAPATPRQQLLCGIFAEVLGVDEVGVDDGFFDLGGQSLLVMRLRSRIRSAIGAKLSITMVFDAPTVAELDAHLSTLDPSAGEGVGAARSTP